MIDKSLESSDTNANQDLKQMTVIVKRMDFIFEEKEC